MTIKSFAGFVGAFVCAAACLIDTANAQQIEPREAQRNARLVGRQVPENTPAEENPDIFCPAWLASSYKTVNVDGKAVKRWVLEDGKYVRCLRMYKMQPAVDWKVKNPEWTQAFEVKYQEFIRALGRSKCKNMDICLASAKANILFDAKDPVDNAGIHYSDCADAPYYLRAYFAYKNKLPFSYIYEFRPVGWTPELEPLIQSHKFDVRYSKDGNYPTKRFGVPQGNGIPRDFFQSATLLQNMVSSGTLRMLKGNPEERLETDFYSPALRPGSIRAGTVIYKTDGHVSMVYDVTADGAILTMDAHPGNYVSHGKISRFELERYSPTLGGGFKNWRPFKLLSPQWRQGIIVGGKIQHLRDEQIADYSLEQYYGTAKPGAVHWRKAPFTLAGENVPYWRYLFSKVAGGNARIDAADEFASAADNLCVQLKERVKPVQVATAKKVNLKKHPDRLPLNIFGGIHDWETYSSPGRDFRLRDLVRKMKAALGEYAQMAKSQRAGGSTGYFKPYAGNDLIGDLMSTFRQKGLACKFTYTNSAGATVQLTMMEALARLPNMSYDPYNCVERRWGATSAEELATCTDSREKSEWHKYQQFLRNLKERNPEEKMAYSLDDLKRMSADNEVNASPKYAADSYDLVLHMNRVQK